MPQSLMKRIDNAKRARVMSLNRREFTLSSFAAPEYTGRCSCVGLAEFRKSTVCAGLASRGGASFR